MFLTCEQISVNFCQYKSFGLLNAFKPKPSTRRVYAREKRKYRLRYKFVQTKKKKNHNERSKAYEKFRKAHI